MYLPSEWHKQQFVQLTWPHEETDWAPILNDALCCYYHMAREIAKRETLLIVTNNVERTKRQLATRLDGTLPEQDRIDDAMMSNIVFIECPNNDTWARDHAFISCLNEGKRLMLDFCFNGWGMKFAANHDNQINRHIFDILRNVEDRRTDLIRNSSYVNHLDFVLEGGSIESDGKGTLLTTSSCLLAPNRNEPMNRDDIDRKLREFFGATEVLWLDHGYLAGDDTDGHIDTLARLCPDNTIVYVGCEDTADEHYEELHLMEEELKAFRTANGTPFRLIALPMPSAIYDEDGERLPATYANFLIVNNAILYPTYAQPACDRQAAEALQTAFPGREIVAIDCQVLIKQHGSLHCCTMQYPETEE